MDIENIIIDKLKCYHQNDINGISELDHDELAKDIKNAIFNKVELSDVLDVIIEYIEQVEQQIEWDRGLCRSLEEMIDAKIMPDIYNKLIDLRNIKLK